MTIRNAIGRQILDHRTAIALETVRRYAAEDLQRGVPFGMDRARFEHYAEYDVAYLAYALLTGRASLMEHYVAWLHSMLSAHGVPSAIVIPAALGHLRDALHEILPSEAHAVVDGLLDAVRTTPIREFIPESFLESGAPHAALASQYLQRLLAADRFGATKLIREAAADGVRVDELYLDVFEPVQREIGRLWQIQKISVAHEHFASATTQMAMSQLYDRIFDPQAERVSRCLVAACVGEELHEIGLRMVADIIEMAGWNTIFLGSNTPNPAIAQTLRETGADVLALSCSMIVHVDKMRSTIAQLRHQGFTDTTILVGGYPFNLAPELASIVGADGTAPDARQAARQIKELPVRRSQASPL